MKDDVNARETQVLSSIFLNALKTTPTQRAADLIVVEKEGGVKGGTKRIVPFESQSVAEDKNRKKIK